MDNKKEEGLRFNQGKKRYDLLHPVAQEGIVKVLTKGAEKYAPKNWEKGMSWSSVVASLKRHLAEFEKGIDFDDETKLLHIDHIQCNAHFLSAFYKIAPQFDDRNHSYLKPKRYALDLDDVLADFTGYWSEQHNINRPTSWQFDRLLLEKFDKMKYDGKLDDFYLNIPVLTKAEDIPFEPVCYVTSRPVDSCISEQWLDKHGFPAAPVITVGMGKSKVDVLKENNIDIMIDDAYHNFTEITNAGIFCYLFDRKHNEKYDVGFRRIFNIKDIL